MKRGFASTITNLFLGIGVLMILMIGITPLIVNYFESGDRIKAEKDINQLKYLLDNLETGETADYFIFSPNWYLTSFSKDSINKGPPEFCKNKDCACIRQESGDNWLKRNYFCVTLKKKISSDGNDLDRMISQMKITFISKEESYTVVSIANAPVPAEIKAYQQERLVKFVDDIKRLGYDEFIKNAALKENTDANLVRAIMFQETGGHIGSDPLVGPCGEAGLMQFMPGTALGYGMKIFEDANFTSCQDKNKNIKPDVAAYRERLKTAVSGKTIAQAAVIDGRFDPEKNINGAVKHIKGLYVEYEGNIQPTIAAYNRGGRIKEDCCPASGECIINKIDWINCVDNRAYLESVYSYYSFLSNSAASA